MRPAGRRWAGIGILVALAAALYAPGVSQAQTGIAQIGIAQTEIAQTEIAKTPPQPRPSAKERGRPAPAVPAGEASEQKARPRTEGWATEVTPRAISALSAEIIPAAARTRFSLVLTQSVPYQVFTLADPYRVIIDMPDVAFQLPTGAGQQGTGVIAAYRFGLIAPGKSRVVIDATGPVRVEAATLVPQADSKTVRLNLELDRDRSAIFSHPCAAAAERRGPTSSSDLVAGPTPQSRCQAADRD